MRGQGATMNKIRDKYANHHGKDNAYVRAALKQGWDAAVEHLEKNPNLFWEAVDFKILGMDLETVHKVRLEYLKNGGVL